MGYYTRYKISTIPDNASLSSNKQTCEHRFNDKYNFCPQCGKPRQNEIQLEKLIADFISQRHPDWGAFDPFDDECKWYEYETDMMEFSKQYPKIVFMLHGEGEKNGDLWNKYFKNGKMQDAKAILTYPPYDENKLK